MPQRQAGDGHRRGTDLPGSDHLWTDQEVARYLNVSVRSVWNWRDKGRLGSVLLSPKNFRFVPEEVIAFAKRNRKAPRCPECGNNGAMDGELPDPHGDHSGTARYLSDLLAHEADGQTSEPVR